MKKLRQIVSKIAKLPIGFAGLRTTAEQQQIERAVEQHNKQFETVKKTNVNESYDSSTNTLYGRPVEHIDIEKVLSAHAKPVTRAGLPEHKFAPHHVDAIRGYTIDSTPLNLALVNDHVNGNREAMLKLPGYHRDNHRGMLSAFAPTKHSITVYSGVSSTHPGKHDKILLPAFTSTSIHRSVAEDFAQPDRTDPQSPYWIRTESHTGEVKTHMMDHKDSVAWNHAFKSYPRNEEKLTEIAKKYGHAGDWHRGIKAEGAMVGPFNHMLIGHLPKGSRAVYTAEHSEHPDEEEVVLPPNTTAERKPGPIHVDLRKQTIYHRVTFKTP